MMDKLSDGQKSCFGFGLLIAAMVLGLVGLIAGWAGQSFKQGAVLGIGVFIFFFVLAAYFFLKVRNWGLLPVIASVAYAILPDLILGPEDDLIVMIVGALISGVIAWRTQRNKVPDLLEG